MQIRKLTLALALAAAFASQAALATDVALTADGQWHVFDVTADLSNSGGLEWIDSDDGSAMSFSFSGPAMLTVVDGGFAGDTFRVYDNGVLLGVTNPAVDSYPNSVGLDFDAALDDPNYSMAVYQVGQGNHVITGELAQSAMTAPDFPINATVGAVQIAAVPEPETYALMLAGLGLLGLASRRRAC